LKRCTDIGSINFKPWHGTIERIEACLISNTSPSFDELPQAHFRAAAGRYLPPTKP
jgi:hypothetical protein